MLLTRLSWWRCKATDGILGRLSKIYVSPPVRRPPPPAVQRTNKDGHWSAQRPKW